MTSINVFDFIVDNVLNNKVFVAKVDEKIYVDFFVNLWA